MNKNWIILELVIFINIKLIGINKELEEDKSPLTGATKKKLKSK